MIETVFLAFLAAKIKGYNIKPILKDWPIYLVLICGLIYIFLEVAVFLGHNSVIKFTTAYKMLFTASFFGIIIKYQLYKSAILGSAFALIGGALNNIAISANGGKMLVYPNLSYITGYISPDTFSKVNDIHALGGSVVKYKFLTDIIDVGYSILSIGDIFIRLFAFILIYSAIKHCSNVFYTKAEVAFDGKTK